jgi:hypothetical protein
VSLNEMVTKIKIYRVNTPVTTISGEIEAYITGCVIRYNGITYEVSYFFDGVYRSVWLHEDEFTVSSKNKRFTVIGFNE